MNEAKPSLKADQWEAEYDAACDELREQMLGADGTQCALIIELWEKKYWKHSRIGPFVVNRSRDMQMALRKNLSSSGNVNIQGNNNIVQHGKNIAQSGDGNSGGNSLPLSSTEAEASSQDWRFYTNVAAGIIAGLLAGWWILPDSWTLGPSRNIATVAIVVASIVMSLLSWFQYRRQVWEKVAYISLGSILILRSTIPSVTGLFKGGAEASSSSTTGEAVGYLSVAEAPLSAAFQVGAALILLGFAFFTRTSDEQRIDRK